MQYKTIVLELIKQRPNLHQRLTSSGSLTSTMEDYAIQLRENHLNLVDQLRQNQPQAAEMQLKSQALEIAVQQLQEDLPDDSPLNAMEGFPLDQAMEFLRRHTPPRE